MNKLLPIRPQQLLPTPWPLFPLLPSQPLNRLLSLPLPLVTSTRSTVKILSSTALLADRWIDDRHAASSSERKDTSSPIAQPVQFYSAFSGSKHAPTPADRLENKYWSCRNPRTTPNLTPVGCTVGPPIPGQLNLEGIPVLGLVDTGASVICMGFSVWWQYRAQWGPLKPFEGVVHGAHGKPLQIAGKTQHLNLQWGEARGRAYFIVIIGLKSPPVLTRMDIMRPLCVRIDVTNGTATPAQPDPQTIHLNAAQKQDPPPTNRALLLQTTNIPAETARLVRCHNPWPNEDVYFCPEEFLPTFVSGVPALSSGSEVWVAIHNHRPEPLRLHAGQNVGNWRLSPSLTLRLPQQPPSLFASHLSRNTCRPSSSNS